MPRTRASKPIQLQTSNERLKAPHPARIQMLPPIFLYLQRTLPFWENNHKSYVEPNIVEELMREKSSSVFISSMLYVTIYHS